MEHVAAPVNAGLRAALAVESLLPVGKRKGLSLVVQAHRAESGQEEGQEARPAHSTPAMITEMASSRWSARRS